MIIGVNGQFRSGKDTIALYLMNTRFFQKIAFADPLKIEVARVLRGTLEAYAVERGCGPNMDQAIHDLLYVNRTPVTRKLLQEWGTELRRNEYVDYWVDRWQEAVLRSTAPGVVAPDMRFENEAKIVKKLGGYCVRVIRPGFEGDSHASENGLKSWTQWDAVFMNDGTIETLWAQVEHWYYSVTSPSSSPSFS